MNKVYIARYTRNDRHTLTSVAFNSYERAKNFLLAAYEKDLPSLLKADNDLESAFDCCINWPPIETAREKFDEFQQISVYGYIETLEAHD